MSEHCTRGGTMHNVQTCAPRTSDGQYAMSVITQLWSEGLEGVVITFSHPVRRCVWCGLVFGYPLFKPEETDDGRKAELELCERHQRDTTRRT